MVTPDSHASQQPFSILAAFLAGIRIVMVNTTLPANIGSAARAMHTMGLTQLTVVAPKLPIDEDAYAHVSGLGYRQAPVVIAGDAHDVFRVFECEVSGGVSDSYTHALGVVDVFAKNDGFGIRIGSVEKFHNTLGNELGAIKQYFLHSRMYKDWGLKKLADYEYHESIDEMKHADTLIDRILFLEGLPNLQKLDKLWIGENTKEMLECDLKLEMAAIPDLKDAIAYAEDIRDYVSRDLFQEILEDEEEHVDWIDVYGESYISGQF